MDKKAEKDTRLAVSYSCGDVGGKSPVAKLHFELQNLAQARPYGDGPLKRGNLTEPYFVIVSISISVSNLDFILIL